MKLKSSFCISKQNKKNNEIQCRYIETKGHVFYKFNVNHVKSKRNLKDFIYRLVVDLTEIQYLAHLTFSIKFIHKVYEILSHALACSNFLM